MMKFVLVGLWVVVVTLGSIYGVSQLLDKSEKPKKEASHFGGIDYSKMKLIGVPVIRNGAMQGYVLAQLVYTGEQKVLDELSVKPDVFITDALIKRVYANEVVDFRKLGKQQISEMLTALKKAANRRYARPVVHDILIERIDYMTVEDVRAGKYRQPAPPAAAAPHSKSDSHAKTKAKPHSKSH